MLFARASLAPLTLVGLLAFAGLTGCSGDDSSSSNGDGNGANASDTSNDGGTGLTTSDGGPIFAGSGSNNGTTSADGGPVVTLGTVSSSPGVALTAAADKWTWVDLPETRCGNGTATGIGVNLHAGATKLVVYMSGGGACFDGQSCWETETATNFSSGYGAADFAADLTTRYALFTRGQSLPAFEDAAWVYIPYCTGDLHMGNGMVNYDVLNAPRASYHYGGHNVDVVIKTLAATFPTVDHLWLSGSSAGGFGSVVNQDYFARGLRTSVDVLDDSGPAVAVPYGGGVTPPASWGARLPPNCTNCTSFPNVQEYDRATYPASRYGFMSYQKDIVLPVFYGVSLNSFVMTLATFEASLAPDANAKYFEAGGDGHVVLAGTGDAETDAAVHAWLVAFTTNDPSWANRTP